MGHGRAACTTAGGGRGGAAPAVQVQKCIKPPPLPTVCDIVQLRLL